MIIRVIFTENEIENAKAPNEYKTHQKFKLNYNHEKEWTKAGKGSIYLNKVSNFSKIALKCSLEDRNPKLYNMLQISFYGILGPFKAQKTN